MQEQIDLLILDRVAGGFFDIQLKYSENSRAIERVFKERGFTVRSNEAFTTISWYNPQLDKMIKPNKKIFSLFTAQDLYYVLTNGKDLRHLTSAVVYEKLIREKEIIETYGMDKVAVFNLFNYAISEAEKKGYEIVINDQGVVTSTFKTNMVQDLRNLSDQTQEDCGCDDAIEIIKN